MDPQALMQQMLEHRVYEAARAAEDAVDDELHKMENMTQASIEGALRVARRQADVLK